MRSRCVGKTFAFGPFFGALAFAAIALAFVSALTACGGEPGPSEPGSRQGDFAIDPAGEVALPVGGTRTVTVSPGDDSTGLDALTASSSNPEVAVVSAGVPPASDSNPHSFGVRAIGPGTATITFRDEATGRSGAVQVTVSEAVALDRPNPARFYTKIGGDADFWDRSGGGVRDAVARWSDLLFVGAPLAEARIVAQELRERAPAGRAPIVLRYWNMWQVYGPAGEARFTDDMYLYRNWPATDGLTRGPRIVNASDEGCSGTPLLDVSRPSVRAEMGRVVRGFLPDFDGVYFDISSWDVYELAYRLGRVGMADGVSCLLAPFPMTSGFVQGFLPSSPEHVVRYHEEIHAEVDRFGTGDKLHFCNALPRRPLRADPSYEQRYLQIFDGCQMDPAFSNVAGQRQVRDDWLFQLETLRRFVSRGKYFMVKIQWSRAPASVRTDALEYGFASYLLGADGRYALFMPAYGFTQWESDPVISAPLGNFAGEMHRAAGSSGSYVYAREFQNGLVLVNADTRPQSVTLPAGSFRDARTGASLSGTVRLPETSGKLLISAGG